MSAPSRAPLAKALRILPPVAGAAAALILLMFPRPLLLLVAMVGLLLALGVQARPEWALLFLVFIIFTRLSNVLIYTYGLPSIAKPFILLFFLAILFRWFVRGRRPENLGAALLITGGYGLIGLLSLSYAMDSQPVLEALLNFVKNAVILLIVVTQIQTAVTLRRVVWTLLLAGIFLGTISTHQYLTDNYDDDYWGFGKASLHNIVSETDEEGYRIGGPGLGPNAFGMFMLLIVPLALDRAWSESNRVLRTLAGWAFIVSVLAIFLTFSRSALIALISLSLFMFIRRPPKLAIAVATIVITVVLLSLMPGRFVSRFAELSKLLPGSASAEIANDVSFRGRVSENISAMQMFIDHPFLGVGLGNYETYYQSYSQRLGLDPRRGERQAHSIYLEILSELGLLGFTWFVGLQFIAFGGLERARKTFEAAGSPVGAHICLAIEAAIIGFLVSGIFNHLAHPRFFWLLYGIALSVPHVAKRELSSVAGTVGESVDAQPGSNESGGGDELEQSFAVRSLHV